MASTSPRAQAFARKRMLRAMSELHIEGIHTTVPAAELVLAHPDFAAGTHSTRWLEEEVDLSGLVSDAGMKGDPTDAPTAQTLTVEVNGRKFEVKTLLPEGFVGVPAAGGSPTGGSSRKAPKPKSAASSGGAGNGTITAPMQGTIVKVTVAVGDTVEVGQSVLVLEAMKMENHINAEQGGTVKEIRVNGGDTVSAGDVLVVVVVE